MERRPLPRSRSRRLWQVRRRSHRCPRLQQLPLSRRRRRTRLRHRRPHSGRGRRQRSGRRM